MYTCKASNETLHHILSYPVLFFSLLLVAISNFSFQFQFSTFHSNSTSTHCFISLHFLCLTIIFTIIFIHILSLYSFIYPYSYFNSNCSRNNKSYFIKLFSEFFHHYFLYHLPALNQNSLKAIF